MTKDPEVRGQKGQEVREASCKAKRIGRKPQRFQRIERSVVDSFKDGNR